MQQAQITAPVGTQLQGRYVIEDLLGQGGFSAVYRVRDRKLGGKRFAIKELRNQSRPERERFLFECEVLKRLKHPALPSVSHIFDDSNQTYMLMEYIDGLNLEALRQKQEKQIFSLAEVITLLGPIVEAVAYLHRQPIPVLHRDIKPANIIVQNEDGRTVLVDFGIAKEYHPDTTTTAIRHCSAGYSAPEQYSGIGTDPRSDIYSLGATCYTLLTGIVPLDALQRTTMYVTKGKDPLVAIHELMPDFPLAVANVIQRALAISAEKRFATVREFWEAVGNAAKQPVVSEQVAVLPAKVETERKDFVGERTLLTGARKRKLRVVIPVLWLVFLLVGAGIPLTVFLISKHTTATIAVVQKPTNKIVKVVPVSKPELAREYRGTLQNLLTKTASEMTLANVQQSQQIVSGNFIGMQGTSAFSGVLDTSKHLLFTVTPHIGQAAFFFEGSIRNDGNLVGNYCRQDGSGQCVGDYGIWSVGPVGN